MSPDDTEALRNAAGVLVRMGEHRLAIDVLYLLVGVATRKSITDTVANAAKAAPIVPIAPPEMRTAAVPAPPAAQPPRKPFGSKGSALLTLHDYECRYPGITAAIRSNMKNCEIATQYGISDTTVSGINRRFSIRGTAKRARRCGGAR